MEKRIWFITGISSGLGKALCRAVMDQGDFVVGTFRSLKEVEAFNHENQDNGRAYFLDLSDLESIEPVIKQVLRDVGRIDILVNNAGVGFVGAVEEASEDEIRTVFEVNVFAPLRITQAVLPSMRKARQGHIIQISSHGGLKAFAGFGIYNASKFALEGFSEALAQEVGPLGIKVSIVEPGPFRTQFAGKGLGEARQVIKDYEETAGTFRKKLKGVHNTQEGDPRKAAAAIIAHATTPNPSLRLPLGKIALMTIGMKLDSVRSDLERNRQIAEDAVFQTKE